MKKRLIEYMRDIDECNYADVSDWMKELRYQTDYDRVEILCNLLLHIEHVERQENMKEGDSK